jgi:hypothetical protein
MANRKLTDKQVEALQIAVETDGVFHVIESAIEWAMEHYEPLKDLELEEDEFIDWAIVIQPKTSEGED